jgi:putative hemolysin
MIRKINIIILIMILLVGGVYAIKNPSAVYCEEMGYEFVVNNTEEGDVGICILPNGSSVGAWNFLKGKVAKEYSYCEKQGYVLKTIEDSEKCSSIFSYDCAVCVKEDGEEIEVTKLMNLSYNEGVCGDDYCFELEESYETCPQDCPFNQKDGYCDMIPDGICDPDCSPEEDIDCEQSKKTNYPALFSLIFLILFLSFLIVLVSIKIFKIIRKRSRRKEGIKTLEKKEKDIGMKKIGLRKDFKKELKEKEKTFKKKERFLDKLLWRKKKAHGREKEVLGRKLKQDRKLLTKKKSKTKKELGKKFETKEKFLKGKVNQEIRKLLSAGRAQLASGNKSEAKNTYRKVRKLHSSLKSSEKNKELYNRILIFHKRLTK